MSDCSRAIRTAVGDETISEAQATEILTRMDNLAKSRAAERGIRNDEALKEIAGELRAGYDSTRLINRRNTLLSLQSFKSQMATIATTDGVWAKNLFRQLEVVFEQTRGLEDKFLSPFFAKLRELDLEVVYREQKHGREVFNETHNVERGGTAPVTPGELGRKLHEFLAFYVKERKQRNALLNERGTYFPEHEDYGFLQSYSKERVRALGGPMDEGNKARARAAFNAFVETLNVHEKTFDGRDRPLFWSHVFDNIYDDNHLLPTDSIDVDAFSGVHGSLANKLSQSRAIWFADPDSQFRWNEALGNGGWGELMLHEMKSRARAISLMGNFGPNWKNTLELIHKNLLILSRERDDSAKQSDALKKFNVDGFSRILSGEVDIPKHPTAARVVREIVNWMHLSKMGAATIASFGDTVFVNNQLAVNGMGKLDRFARQMAIVRDRDSWVGINVVGNAAIGGLARRYNVGGGSKVTSWASHKMFQWNLFNAWNDMHAQAMGSGLAWWMGKHSDRAFDALPEGLATELQKAGIDGPWWDAIRSSAGPMDEAAGELAPDGATSFVFMDRLQNIPDNLVDRIVESKGQTVTAANRKRARGDIGIRLATYFSNQTDAALNVPNLQTRYVTTFGGQAPGTLPRNVADLLLVFKSFPLSVALRFKDRAREAGVFEAPPWQWGKDQWSFTWDTAKLVAYSAVAGYMVMTTKDLLNGRTPRRLIDDDGNPNASVFVAALAKGGGLGIMGDFLFSEYDRQYKSALSTIAGPALGLIDPLGALYTGVRNMGLGEETKEKPLSEAFNLAVNNLPFGNLFYIRPILNNFIFWNIREALSPGVLRRAERKTREMYHQDYLIEPSDIADIPVTEPGRKLEAIFGE